MIKRKVWETTSPEETKEIGRKLGEGAKAGQVYTLNGDLGVGKTVFTKGFARGLGITGTVNSPTFTILQTYTEGRLPLCHFDVYRIADPDEMLEVGWDDYVWGDGVCLIEWAELISPLIEELPAEKVHKITIGKDLSRGVDFRRITLEEEENEDSRA